jgi:hypothetical protein
LTPASDANSIAYLKACLHTAQAQISTTRKGNFMQHPIKRHSAISRALLPALALLSLPASLLAEGESVCEGLTQAECRAISSRNVFALLGNNTVAYMHGSKVVSVKGVGGDIDGNLIGLDYRPSQQANASRNNSVGLYGLSDTGKIYQLDLNAATGGGPSTLVATLTTEFEGGFQSLLDFNPVADALRVIGSNDQNFAVVNSNGNLDATAVQTRVTYAAGDPQAGRDPNLTGGAYTNNVAGAATTIFFALDYARDTLVTIADVTNGSSATGGGRLKTLGRIVDREGRRVNILPEAGMDIFTDQSIGNGAIIASGQKLYFLNLATVNASAAVGTTRDVVVTELGADVSAFVRLIQVAPGTFMDVAATPGSVLANPADLSLERVANLGQGQFVEGQPYTIELKVTNLGPDTQNGVQLFAFALPFKDPVVTTSQGRCTLNALSTFGRTFQCSIGTLAFNASATVNITVRRVAEAFVGDARVDANFQTQGPDGGLTLLPGDPDSTNNKATVTVFLPQ